MRAQFWGKAIIKLLCAISFSSFNCLTFVCPCYFLIFLVSFFFYVCNAYSRTRNGSWGKLKKKIYKIKIFFPNNLIALWDFSFFSPLILFCFASTFIFKWRHSAWKSKMNKNCTVAGGEKNYTIRFCALCPQETPRLA